MLKTKTNFNSKVGFSNKVQAFAGDFLTDGNALFYVVDDNHTQELLIVDIKNGKVVKRMIEGNAEEYSPFYKVATIAIEY